MKLNQSNYTIHSFGSLNHSEKPPLIYSARLASVSRLHRLPNYRLGRCFRVILHFGSSKVHCSSSRRHDNVSPQITQIPMLSLILHLFNCLKRHIWHMNYMSFCRQDLLVSGHHCRHKILVACPGETLRIFTNLMSCFSSRWRSHFGVAPTRDDDNIVVVASSSSGNASIQPFSPVLSGHHKYMKELMSGSNSSPNYVIYPQHYSYKTWRENGAIKCLVADPAKMPSGVPHNKSRCTCLHQQKIWKLAPAS